MDLNNYDKANYIYMAPTDTGFMPQKLPGPASYPVFNENGQLVKPGEGGGQFNPIKYSDMASQMKNNTFDYAAGNRYQMSQNEIIRYNIEKLGGITSTLDSKKVGKLNDFLEMQDTLLKNELNNIKKNEASSKAGYTTDLLNPDKPPNNPSNPRGEQNSGYGFRKTQTVFGSTGRIGFDPGNLGQTKIHESTYNPQPDLNHKKGSSSRVLPTTFGLSNPPNSRAGQARGFLGMKLN